MPSYLSRRRALRYLRRIHGLLSWLFFVQAQVPSHPAKRKAVLTPRRAGKTELVCAWLLDAANKAPGRKFLYVALSRRSAKDIAWGIFKKLNKEFRLGAKFHESDVNITLPNGAIIMLRGADQANWVERLEGQEFDKIVVDEAGLYEINLRKVIYGSLAPMVDSCGGELCLIGRPGAVKAGLFWDVTDPEKRPGPKLEDGAWMVEDKVDGEEWAVFNWSTFENPFVAEFWRQQIEKKIRINPDIVNQPLFRRHYLGEWVEETEGLVYAYEAQRNIIEDFVPMEGDRFGLGLDFGWDDAQAFVIGCWNPRRPDFIIVESFKQHHMPLADAIARIEMYQARYPGLLIWGDPARKQLYNEVATRFGPCVNEAAKHEKHDYIDLMNNDFALGRIKIVRATNQQYIAELTSLLKLIKDTVTDQALDEVERAGKWIEHPKMANDLCDSALYVWRNSRHYRFQEEEKKPAPGSPEAAQAEIDDVWARERERTQKKTRKDWWRR